MPTYIWAITARDESGEHRGTFHVQASTPRAAIDAFGVPQVPTDDWHWSGPRRASISIITKIERLMEVEFIHRPELTPEQQAERELAKLLGED